MELIEHRTDETDVRSRGLAYGAATRAHVRRALDGYAEYWRAHGLAVERTRERAAAMRECTRDWWPEVVDELDAVADGAGADALDLFALNARTEVMAVTARTPGECSTVALVAPPRVRSIQTWDWHPPLTPAAVLLEQPGATGGVKTFTEPGMLGKIGVNGAGLVVHFNILNHTQDASGADGVPVHVVARRVLCEARTVTEAVDLVRSASAVASTVLTVTSGTGDDVDAACLELSPAGAAVVRPDADGYLWHTNHFRDPGLAEGERTESPTTHPRGCHLEDVREGLIAAQTPADLASAFCGAPGPQAAINVRPDTTLPEIDQVATLATVVPDPERMLLYVASGGPSGFTPQVF